MQRSNTEQCYFPSGPFSDNDFRSWHEDAELAGSKPALIIPEKTTKTYQLILKVLKIQNYRSIYREYYSFGILCWNIVVQAAIYQ